ncbi:hypothetical protein AB0D14_09120 [Streptomyces sp. NPDC048484]|uniref:hypothetical protein n=1 Tax=Streptomyces sp. NPDC048484 TaxID=3155146 RepID=UPI0034411496
MARSAYSSQVGALQDARELQTAILRHDVVVLGTVALSALSAPSAYDASLSSGLSGLPASSGFSGPDLTSCTHPGPGPVTTPFVGRGEETARLTALLSAATAGRPQWAVVGGEQ